MHPLVMQSIAEQRLEDLRKDSRPGNGRPSAPRARPGSHTVLPWPVGPHRGQDRYLDGDHRIATRPQRFRVRVR